jgi:polar amino acid transport system permease protein
MTQQPLSPTTRISTAFDLELAKSRPIKVKHYGEMIIAAVVVLLLAALLFALAGNENLDYGVVAQYLFSGEVLHGLMVTLQLSVIGMLIGIVLGTVIALGRLSNSRVLQAIASAYVWFFRGVPLLVQLLIWGNFALLFPRLGLGIPFTDVMFVSMDTNVVITVFVAACIGLGFHEAAYMGEVIRGGILSVDAGQKEAAIALGMKPGLATRRIILPQAFRVIIPPTGNQFISLLKASSLVAVIAGGDLLHEVQNIGAINYRIIEMLFVATFWYLVIVSALSVAQHYLERYASRGRSH